VTTCRQSPYVHEPAIVKLLLLIYRFQFRSVFRSTTTPLQPSLGLYIISHNICFGANQPELSSASHNNTIVVCNIAVSELKVESM